MRSQQTVECGGNGTSLADAVVVPPAPGFRTPTADAVWRSQRDRFFLSEARTTSRLTIGLGVFVQLAIVAIMWDAGYPTWRVVALLAIYAAFALAHKVILGCTDDPQKTTQSFIQMNIAAQLMIIGSISLTGGIHSPFIPSATVPAIISLLFFGPQAVSRWM